MKRPIIAAITLGLASLACGEVPARTEQARGVAGGANLVLVLSVVFVVVSVGLIVGAIAVDRVMRSRRALAELSEAPEEEPDETEVAGIGIGTGTVPKWLYGFYVLIPVWALVFVFTNVDLSSPAGEEPTEAPPTTEEPVDGAAVISALNIQFDRDTLGPFEPETEITVTFENDDSGIPHNVAVYDDDSMSESIFVGEIFPGVAERDYTFTTPAAGTYYFQCDVQPSMNGDFVVEAG